MELHTPICDLLCCDLPIVLAGMGGVARSELVGAVTQAGGFAFLGMVRESPRLIRSEIEAVRRRTDRPFGVNLIPAATEPGLLTAQLDACIAARIHAVALFWDLSPHVVRTLRAEGVLVACQVGSLAEAKAAEDAGADLLILQGVEAGGHVRGLRSLDALLAEALPQLETPFLAAGGVTDGRDLARVLTLGAQGAVIGTAFLATDESYAHAYHKQRIVDAGPETIHTEAFHINWPPGAAVRVLPNSVTRGARGDPFATARQVIGADGARPIYLFSTDSPLRSTTGDLEGMALYAGQGAARITGIVPAGERMRAIADEARSCLSSEPAPPPPSAAPPAEPSSPVCYAGEAPDRYMGYADPGELASELNELLEAERAGARVAARLVADAPDPEFRSLARVIHADEVRWCRALFAALTKMQAEASDQVGGFYGKAMAVHGLEARLAYVNRGQGWVVRKLRALLPRVRDEALHRVLREMLQAHERNIENANEALTRRAVREPAGRAEP